jgi:hypothetical protein
VGEHVKPGDYPPGFFSEEETDELNRSSVAQDKDGNFVLAIRRFTILLTLHHFTSCNISEEEFAY